MPVGDSNSIRTPFYKGDSESTDGSGNKKVKKLKNFIDVDKVAEQFADSDLNDDETRYKVASQIASENLSDKENVSKEEYKQEIDKVYAQLGSSNTGQDVRKKNSNIFFDAVGGLRDLINGANHGIASGVDWLYDNTIGGLTGTQDLFNANDVEGVVDILGDIALTAAGPAGWAAALGKNAIQNSDALYEGVTGKDAITGLDIDDGARQAGLAQGIGLTALAGLGGVGRAVGSLSKASKAGTRAAQEVAEDAAKAGTKAGETAAESAGRFTAVRGGTEAAANAAEDAAEEVAEEAAKKFGIRDAFKSVKEAGNKAVEGINRPLQNGGINQLTPKELKAHAKKANKIRRQAMKQEAQNIKDNYGITIPASISELPGKTKDAVVTTAKNTAESVKNIPESIKNIPDNIQNQTIPRMKVNLGTLHPFNKDVREVSKEYLRQNAPKDIQEANMRALKAIIDDAESAASAQTKAQKAGGVALRGVKGLARNVIGPGAAASLPIAYLDALDDTQANYGSSVIPAFAGALLSRGTRANIGLTGKPGSSIPNLMRSANMSARARRRNLAEDAGLEPGTYSEKEILDALKVRK